MSKIKLKENYFKSRNFIIFIIKRLKKKIFRKNNCENINIFPKKVEFVKEITKKQAERYYIKKFLGFSEEETKNIKIIQK